MELAQIATLVGIASSTALVVSVLLLAYNLWVSRRDARRNLAFSLMEQLTSKEFADRRWRMRECIRKASANGWDGFDDCLDDFEARAFAYQYELIGQMVIAGTLEYPQLRNFLQYTIINDWNAFAPLESRLMERYPGRPSPWERFRALADRITTELHGPPVQPRTRSDAPPPRVA